MCSSLLAMQCWGCGRAALSKHFRRSSRQLKRAYGFNGRSNGQETKQPQQPQQQQQPQMHRHHHLRPDCLGHHQHHHRPLPPLLAVARVLPQTQSVLQPQAMQQPMQQPLTPQPLLPTAGLALPLLLTL